MGCYTWVFTPFTPPPQVGVEQIANRSPTRGEFTGYPIVPRHISVRQRRLLLLQRRNIMNANALFSHPHPERVVFQAWMVRMACEYECMVYRSHLLPPLRKRRSAQKWLRPHSGKQKYLRRACGCRRKEHHSRVKHHQFLYLNLSNI